MAIDKNAILVNGYDSAYCQGSIKKICDGLRYAYNNQWGLLENEKEYIINEYPELTYYNATNLKLSDDDIDADFKKILGNPDDIPF